MKNTLEKIHLTTDGLLISAILLAIVILTSHYNYLLFHSLVEFFSIVTSFGIFILSWNSRTFVKNNYLLFVGFSALFIGLLDMLHLLAYKGMGVFTDFDANLPTQLWIAARYIQISVLLFAPLTMRKRLRSNIILLSFAFVFTLLVGSIFVLKIFPDCFIEGRGLTPFKIISEYCIVALICIATILLYQVRSEFEPGVYGLLNLYAAFFCCSEIAFTSYLGVYDTANLIGHILRVASFYFIYRAIIVTGIVNPFALIFRELQHSKDAIQKYSNQLESMVDIRTEELTMSNQLLQQEIVHHKETQEKIRKRVSQLKALRTIDIAIGRSFDLNGTLQLILDQVNNELNVDASAILLYDARRSVLEYAAGNGFRTTAITRSALKIDSQKRRNTPFIHELVRIPQLSNYNNFSRRQLIADEKFVSYYSAPLLAKGHFLGILEIYTRSELLSTSESDDFLEMLAGQAAIAIDNATLFRELQDTSTSLRLAYEATMEGWVKALDLRDKKTEGHTQRVADMTVLLARTIGIDNQDLVNVRRGALLHDIGKIGVPDNILNKPGPLDEWEWRLMREHPVYALNMLSPIQYLSSAVEIPYCHHERWDGTGYPRGLKKEEIPLPARIFAVVDVWDALSSDRPYRPAMDIEDVYSFIRSQSGTHFDPGAVAAFFDVLPQPNHP